ncbi:MAG: peptidylprolyl isomerase [bacterium]|jgi:tetratricopeptide (TPR) repeat protein|nr:peptidylprolyl isomerase [bacterium]
MRGLSRNISKAQKFYLLVLVGIFIITVFVKKDIETDRIKYDMLPENLSPSDQVLGGLVGAFREITADYLWVTMDSFFHSGDWQRLVPTIDLVARLDPKFIQVWSVGAWHFAYNISVPASSVKVKEQMIRQGDEFLEKGIRYNPHIYDLHFELGWNRFDRQLDYQRALPEIKAAYAIKDHPHYVRHMVAHTLERLGRIEETKKLWKQCIDEGDCSPAFGNYSRLLKGDCRIGVPIYKLRNRGQEWEKCLADKIQVSEAEIEAYYNAHKDLYMEPKKIQARHILLSNRAAAVRVLERLKKGEDFAALASKVSIDKGTQETGGSLGLFPRGQMVPEFDRAAFALKENQVSDIVKTKFGYHVIKVEKCIPARLKSLKEVRTQVRDKVVDDKIQANVQRKLAAGYRWGVPEIKTPEKK